MNQLIIEDHQHLMSNLNPSELSEARVCALRVKEHLTNHIKKGKTKYMEKLETINQMIAMYDLAIAHSMRIN